MPDFAQRERSFFKADIQKDDCDNALCDMRKMMGAAKHGGS
jgi:hypothetical protein